MVAFNKCYGICGLKDAVIDGDFVVKLLLTGTIHALRYANILLLLITSLITLFLDFCWNNNISIVLYCIYIIHVCIYIYIYIYIYVRFTWDQVVSVRPASFTWNFTLKHCEGKKKSNIHNKNTVKVTFTEFFVVKVLFFVTFTAFSLWMFHFFTPFWNFFTSKVFFRDEYSNFIYLHGVL